MRQAGEEFLRPFSRFTSVAGTAEATTLADRSVDLVTASEAHRQAEINLALQDFNVVKARILALLALATCPW